MADTISTLEELVADDGMLLVSTPQGRRPHPALVEARQQRLVLVKLLRAMELPMGAEEQEEPVSPPRRLRIAEGTGS